MLSNEHLIKAQILLGLEWKYKFPVNTAGCVKDNLACFGSEKAD